MSSGHTTSRVSAGDPTGLDDFLRPGGAWESPLVAGLLAARRPLPELPAGARVGPFRIIAPLGRGGMAMVYRGERVDGDFEQRVALKFLHSAHKDADSETLFRRERRILAALEHASIARLIDGGRRDDGLQWLAMELVEGERIDEYVERVRSGAGGVVALLISAARAVAYAHAHLAVHRDIKPSNVMVNAAGEVKLLDFGIASLLAEEGIDDPAQTALTPRYASPEQKRGEATGVVADVFQLGFLLAELLAIDARGRAALNESDARGRAALSEDVALPRVDDTDLQAIIDHATASDPQARYPSAAALIEDLQRWRDGFPVAARRGGWSYRGRRFLRRHVAAVTVAGLASATLIVFTALHIVQLDAARQTAEAEASKARAVSSFLASVFNAASPYVARGEKPTVESVLHAGVERLQTSLADQPAVRGELYAVIGRVYVTLNQLESARPLLQQAVALAEQDPSLTAAQRAARLRLLGVSLQSAHRGEEAEAIYEQALSLLEGDDSEAARRELSGLMRNLVLIRYQRGDIADAIALQRKALAEALRQFGERDLQVARARANLGQFLANYGAVDEGVAMVASAYASLREQLGEAHPEVTAIGGAYGGMLIERGDLEQGGPLLEASIAAGFKSTPEGSPWYPLQLGYRGYLRKMQGRLDEALQDLTLALAIASELPAADDLNSVAMMETLGEVQLEQGKAEAALATFQRMIERNRDGRHAIRADLGHRPLLMATALQALGRCVDAQEWLARAEALLEVRTIPSHPLRGEARELREACAEALRPNA